MKLAPKLTYGEHMVLTGAARILTHIEHTYPVERYKHAVLLSSRLWDESGWSEEVFNAALQIFLDRRVYTPAGLDDAALAVEDLIVAIRA